MRIAIFGGTFNPVHDEHYKLAVGAIKELCLDKLIVVPTFITPNKSGAVAGGKDRINMLKIAFDGVNKAEISDYEIKNGGMSYTYLTVEHFKSQYPDAQLFFLVGGDMLKDFKTWKNPERILKAVKLAVFKRNGDDANYLAEQKYFEQRFQDGFIKLPLVGNAVSSTEIRTYFALGLKPDGVSQKVYEYAVKNKVYPESEYTAFLKKHLTEKRLIHTANVAACALKKAKELSLDKDEVFTAAILHDCAKYLSVSDFSEFTLPEGVPEPVVHQYLGAYVAEKVLGVKDESVLDAIRYHTSGKAEMTTLGKLIFTADMVEKGRTYEGVEKLRALYETDFNKCFKECVKEEVLHLKNKGTEIYFETLNAYDYYVKE